jgi:flagellar biosynthesis/type III secretory pathway protein FliH
MNTQPPQKPPTRESVEAARRFASSLPALAQPREKPPTDYERGFADGHEAGYQAGLRKSLEITSKQH